MNDSKSGTSSNALMSLIRSSLTAEGSQTFGQIVLYTSFGVVRGRLGLSFTQELLGQERGGTQQGTGLTYEVIELNHVTVEHYSNHLPTASFNLLYVRLADAQGFALMPL